MNVTPVSRRQLEGIVGDRNAPQKHRQNHPATAVGCGTTEIMRRSGKAKPVVWRWRKRFMREGVAGLTRDRRENPATRSCHRPPYSSDRSGTWFAAGTSHELMGRMLATAAGVSLR